MSAQPDKFSELAREIERDILDTLKASLPYFESDDRDDFIYLARIQDVKNAAGKIAALLRNRLGEEGWKFPEHKCGLFLTHNEHRDYYEKLTDYIEERELADTFESPEAMQRSIETDEHWHLQWYPDTPVGFYHVSAPTLEEVLLAALPASPAAEGGRS